MAAGMTNGAIGIPVWVALNSSAPAWVGYCAALVSLVLGLTLAFLLSRVVTFAGDTPLRSTSGYLKRLVPGS